jgi:uncharacterized protein YggE
LKRDFGDKVQLQTASFSVSPNYEPRPPAESAPRIESYSASAIMRATLRQIDLLGQVLDVAVQAGANQIHGLHFGLKDSGELSARALREAAQDAKKQAEALASALNLRIGRVLSVREAGAPITPLRQGFETAAVSAVPIEPGMIETSAEVTLEFEVAPAER